MMHQNEGFEPTYVPGVKKNGDLAVKKNGKLTFVANKNGVRVPAREWFGIPKTYQEGGTKYNKFLNKLVDAYNDIFNTAIKKG